MKNQLGPHSQFRDDVDIFSYCPIEKNTCVKGIYEDLSSDLSTFLNINNRHPAHFAHQENRVYR